MLALLLGIAAAAGWIIFDVAVSVVTYPLMPRWEWWAFVPSGGVLVILTIAAQILDYLAHQKDEKRHSNEHVAIATGTNAIFERLATLTQTTGRPAATVFEAAMARIESLENQVRNQQWRQITAEQRQRFRDALQGERPEIWGIYCVIADSEADGYTKQLMKMIRDCGIVINDHPDKDADRSEFDTHGLIVLVKNASAPAPNALTLTRALDAASIVYHLTALKVGRSAPDNYLALRVGPKAK